MSSEATYLQIFCFFLELTFTETYKVMEEMQQVGDKLVQICRFF